MIYLGCTATEGTHCDLHPVIAVKVIILLIFINWPKLILIIYMYTHAHTHTHILYNLNYL